MTNLEAGTAAASEQVLRRGLQQALQQSQSVRFLGNRKISGPTGPGIKILLDQPKTKARIAAINIIASARRGPRFLNAAEWAILKRICEA